MSRILQNSYTKVSLFTNRVAVKLNYMIIVKLKYIILKLALPLFFFNHPQSFGNQTYAFLKQFLLTLFTRELFTASQISETRPPL